MMTGCRALGANKARVVFAALMTLVSCSKNSSSPSTEVPTPATFAITASLSAINAVLNTENAASDLSNPSGGDPDAGPPPDAGSSKYEGTFTGPDGDGCWNGGWTEPDQSAYVLRLCPTPRWDQGVAVDDAGIAQFVVNASGSISGPVRTGTFAAMQTVWSVVPPLPDGGFIIITDPDGGEPPPPPPPPDAAPEQAFSDQGSTTDGGGVITDTASGLVFRFSQTGEETIRFDGGVMSQNSIVSLLGFVDAGQEFRLTTTLSATIDVGTGNTVPSGSATAIMTGEFWEIGVVTLRLRIDGAATISATSNGAPTYSGYYTLAGDNFTKQNPLSDAQIQGVVEKLFVTPL
ncbi:MAG: hypothetical protein HYY84_10225 [Deltaproteobacteria bacterium]|nr:hypothetical protein [Deltaproteobacteria bacterium]